VLGLRLCAPNTHAGFVRVARGGARDYCLGGVLRNRFFSTYERSSTFRKWMLMISSHVIAVGSALDLCH